MIVLAIDPGSERSAWLTLDTSRGVISNHGIVENVVLAQRLRHHALSMDLDRPGATVRVAIERVESFGMAVGHEVFETVRWAGRFEEAVHPTRVELVTRREVKLHLCGSMRAKDANIRQALIDKLGPQGTKKSPGPTYGISRDVWSALAIAVTYAETRANGTRPEASGDMSPRRDGPVPRPSPVQP